MAVTDLIAALKSWSNTGEALFGNDLNSNFTEIRNSYNAHTHDEFPELAATETITGAWTFSALLKASVGVQLGTNAWLTGLDGTGKNVVRYNTAFGVQVGDGTAIIGLGVASVPSPAVAGDAVLAHGKALRGISSNGLAARELVAYKAIGGDDAVVVGGTGDRVVLGAPSGIAGSVGGDLVVAHDKAIRFEDSPRINAVEAFSVSSATLRIGRIGWAIAMGGPSTVMGATEGDVVLRNDAWLRAANAAGTTASPIIRINASNKLQIGAARSAAANAANFSAVYVVELVDGNGNSIYIPAAGAAW